MIPNQSNKPSHKRTQRQILKEMRRAKSQRDLRKRPLSNKKEKRKLSLSKLVRMKIVALSVI